MSRSNDVDVRAKELSMAGAGRKLNAALPADQRPWLSFSEMELRSSSFITSKPPSDTPGTEVEPIDNDSSSTVLTVYIVPVLARFNLSGIVLSSCKVFAD